MLDKVMLPFLKRKQIIIDCYIDCKRLAKNHPVKRGAKFLPEWWKQLPSTYPMQTENGIMRPVPTVRKCGGLINLYTQGWILPAWSDILLKTREDGYFAYEYPVGPDWARVETHSREQFKGAFEGYIHMKIISPWVLVDRHETNTKFLWTPASWSLFDDQPEFRVLPGIVDFTDNIGTHLNMLLPAINKEYLIKAGTPLVHLSPITEKKVTFETHTMSSSELLQLKNDRNPRADFVFSRRGL